MILDIMQGHSDSREAWYQAELFDIKHLEWYVVSRDIK
jgi:hypothetical protein